MCVRYFSVCFLAYGQFMHLLLFFCFLWIMQWSTFPRSFDVLFCRRPMNNVLKYIIRRKALIIVLFSGGEFTWWQNHAHSFDRKVNETRDGHGKCLHHSPMSLYILSQSVRLARFNESTHTALLMVNFSHIRTYISRISVSEHWIWYLNKSFGFRLNELARTRAGSSALWISQPESRIPLIALTLSLSLSPLTLPSSSCPMKCV